MGVVLLFLVIGERIHPVGYSLIWNHLQVEILQDKLRTLGKISSIFYEQVKRTVTMESSTSRRLKESKKNIFYRKQKNCFCNIKCFKKLLTIGGDFNGCRGITW